MTLEQRAVNGSRAREVLENEQFQQAFADIEKDFVEQWTNSPARDVEGREKLWLCLTLLRKVRTQLIETMDSGKLARLELTHQAKMQEFRSAEWNG